VKLRILVVEDEKSISEPLAEGLAREGFDTEIAETLESARQAWRRSPDLILLDVMLRDDGRDLAREIRRESDVPIIMLTARGEEIDRVVGLELGADDYVVKPFSMRELTARIRAILRRGRSGEPRAPIEIGEIRLDPASRTLTKGDQPVELAAKEFDLLQIRWPTQARSCLASRSWTRSGTPTGSARPRRSCMSRGCGRRSRTIRRTRATSPRFEAWASGSSRRTSRRIPARVRTTPARGRAVPVPVRVVRAIATTTNPESFTSPYLFSGPPVTLRFLPLGRRSDDLPEEVEMRNAFRIVLVIGAIVIVAALGLTAFASGSSPTLSSTPTSTMSPSDDGPFDISGTCDEPEHFNDPECQGVAPGVGNDVDDDRADDVDGLDADDVNDDDDDADGIGDDDVDGVDNDGDVDDNSGPIANSGPGTVEDDDDAGVDNSGPGNGDDDADADHSGSGNGDHDDSGPGSGHDD
jgi:CheY-like chemotaxis protein